MKSSFMYFLTFMSGIAIGMMTGYIAGSKKQVYVDSHMLESMSKKKDDFDRNIQKEVDKLKKDYKSRLKELSRAINDLE